MKKEKGEEVKKAKNVRRNRHKTKRYDRSLASMLRIDRLLTKAIMRTQKSVKSKYSNESIAGIVEWR
jgi:hypothetical protein